MTPAEAWETYEALLWICSIIGYETAPKLIANSKACENIAQRTKCLKEFIINNYEENLAHLIYELTHERDYEPLDFFYMQNIEHQDKNPTFADDMLKCYSVLSEISDWLMMSVHKIPQEKVNKYRLKDRKPVWKRPRTPRPKTQTLPYELRTKEFMRILDKTVKVGLCIKRPGSETDKYNWIGTKTLLAYFADKCTEKLRLRTYEYVHKDEKGHEYITQTTCFLPFEILFLTKENSLRKLKSNYKSSSTGFPKGHEKVDAIFSDLK